MITIFRCSHCSFEDEDKAVVLAHEATHAVDIVVMYVGQQETREGKLTVSPEGAGNIKVILEGGLRNRRTFIAAGRITDGGVLLEASDDGNTEAITGVHSEEDAAAQDTVTNVDR